MNDKGYSLNDVGSNKTDKEEESFFKKNQKLIIILSSIIILSIMIILIIIFSLNKSSDKKEPKKIFGTIKCIYDIKTKEAFLLGQEYIKDIDLDI